MSEYGVAVHLLSLGYRVYWPAIHSSDVDLILDIGGRALRVQVKTAKYRTPRSKPTVAIEQKKYANSDLDFLAVWDPRNQRAFLIPWNLVGTRNHQSLEKLIAKTKAPTGPD